MITFLLIAAIIVLVLTFTRITIASALIAWLTPLTFWPVLGWVFAGVIIFSLLFGSR